MESSKFAESRLGVLREIIGLTQGEFAEKMGISQSALSQLESGKTKLSMDSMEKLSETFNVNCNWLVVGKGNIFIKSNTEIPVKKEIPEIFITRSLDEEALVPLIREEAQAGYINGFDDKEFLRTLDVYKIPGYENGNYRLFEISGESMLPTIHPREIVVSECCDDWSNIENGSLGVVVADDGVVAKRLYFYDDDRSVLILKSDNNKFKTYTVQTDDIKEIWLIKGKITNNFASDNLIDANKIRTIEEEISSLREELHKMKKSGD